jgi:hypothetical protein
MRPVPQRGTTWRKREALYYKKKGFLQSKIFFYCKDLSNFCIRAMAVIVVRVRGFPDIGIPDYCCLRITGN